MEWVKSFTMEVHLLSWGLILLVFAIHQDVKAIEKSDLYPYGASVGDQKLPSKSKYVNHTDEDDVSSPEIRLNTYIKFYSSEYGAIYVSKIVTSVKK